MDPEGSLANSGNAENENTEITYPNPAAPDDAVGQQSDGSRDFEELCRCHVQFRMENSVLSDHLTVLEIVRKQLASFQEEGETLKKRLNEDAPRLNHIKDEIKVWNKTKAKLRELLDIGTQEADGPTPPHALEYMQLKQTAQSLEKEVQQWSKKVEIAAHASSQLEHQLQAKLLAVPS